MEGAGGDNFQDWEVLQSSDSESDSAVVNSPDKAAAAAAAVEGEIDDGDYSDGMIRSDYFSLDNQNRYAKTDVVSEEEGSIDSDNPSWIDPGSETRYPLKNLGEFWSDSGSDRSDERKLGEFQAGSVRMGGFDGGLEKGSDMSNTVGVVVDDHVKNQEEESEIACGGSDDEEGKIVNSSGGEGERRAVSKAVGGEEGRIVWWKVPFEVLKYCVSKVNPVWSFSVAAAVVGLVILGRKLYRMKRKTRSLQLKVTLDDKKVSQFMSRAARLNEAFSVVRRVPIVRPALPAPGVNSWPVMSMR